MAEEIAHTMGAAVRAADAIAAQQMSPDEAVQQGIFPDGRAMIVTKSRVMVVVYTMLLRALLKERMGELCLKAVTGCVLCFR